jgi:hypothetical protein
MFCELTKTSLSFYEEAGQGKREAADIVLNLESDIISITLEGLVITINESLFLKFDTDDVLNTWVTAL